jgi:hypothetical protein
MRQMVEPIDEKLGYQPGHILSRNSREGFVVRTLKNLTYIEEARRGANPADVHEVTQLMLSMLGLVIIQWERGAFDPHLASRFQQALNTTIADFGGPLLRDMRDNYHRKCTTVRALVRHLRNAVAHGRFIFSNESRAMDDVSIKFFDENSRTGETWEATIDAPELKEFCVNLARRIPV